jgi:glucose-6-phosphate isomerase
MPIVQSIDSAREERIGTHGVPAGALAETMKRAEAALDWLRARHADGALPLLRYPEKTGDLAAIRDAARRLLPDTTDVVVLGTGGSSLGGQTLAQLGGSGVPGVGAFTTPRAHFIDNLDPVTFDTLLAKLPLKTTRFVAISKSGGTGETLMQTIAALTALRAAGIAPRDRFFAISEPDRPGRRNGLRDLLGPEGVLMLDHDAGVGGRFSVLTNVGLLPAAIFGFDLTAIRNGAAVALAPVLAKKAAAEVPAALGAALAVTLAERKSKTISVIMSYSDRLDCFTRWYVQLWAESLGKSGKGTTPVGVLGPVDQHSQLQLFIGGPRDKLFTVVTTDTAGRGPRIDAALASRAGEPGLGDRTIGDLVAAQGRATAQTLAKSGCPVRTLHVPAIDEAGLGELLMHFMPETIITARLMGIDAFDQPAVEEGKLLAKQYLEGR